MALQSPFWSANVRLQQAADNKKSMRLFEPDKFAVALLQTALVNTGLATIKIDGIFGEQTAKALRAVETRFNMDRDEGIAARQTLGIIDILLQNGQLGQGLAQGDTQLAIKKVKAALQALTFFQTSRQNGTALDVLTVDALITHFRISASASTLGASRPVKDTDLATIIERYTQLLGLYKDSATRFRTGAPVNGIFTAAEAPVNGPITFGPAFTNVNSNFGGFIGNNSRAAVLIHEGVHVFDRDSGRKDTHISEFEPAYGAQPADLSLHNPSSYAGFAAHIDLKRDPVPRFGLGPGARGL
ncbi:peptidoglycan-binding protein [Spirosoma endbachense]|uniref:Peptidoglycan binding-like domain-containing protein n=1 Tax=Spirosoma endbachense TaxID=2666025 RepID=A0A6P1VQB1_9BACT|nr:peptidoglycan-binding protein [Spirosoma endbachense]QHV94608.1 hypothetical protein GJR95_06095 [Spirosoma endbachense]